MNVRLLFALVTPAVIASACAKDTAAPAAPVPVSATVATSPLPGATGVPTTADVMVQFDSAVDSASCAARFAVYMGDTSGVPVPGRMTWDSTYHHMTFVPDSALSPDSLYTVYMRDGMMTRGTMMNGGGMGGMGGEGGQSGSPMTFENPPAGATRTGDGMMWSFLTRR